MTRVIGENLACVRGGRLVFRDVNFRVSSGDVLQVEGPNGSGKTSLLRLIAGLLRPQAGSIVLTRDGAEISGGEERGRHVGWLGHQDSVKPQITPRETLNFYAELLGIPSNISKDLTSHFIEKVGLSRAVDLPCRFLSAGQRKRLALARLQVSARLAWLLDEPLSALDSQGRSLLRELITEHQLRGGIVIAATHESLGLNAARLQLS